MPPEKKVTIIYGYDLTNYFQTQWHLAVEDECNEYRVFMDVSGNSDGIYFGHIVTTFMPYEPHEDVIISDIAKDRNDGCLKAMFAKSSISNGLTDEEIENVCARPMLIVVNWM